MKRYKHSPDPTRAKAGRAPDAQTAEAEAPGQPPGAHKHAPISQLRSTRYPRGASVAGVRAVVKGALQGLRPRSQRPLLSEGLQKESDTCTKISRAATDTLRATDNLQQTTGNRQSARHPTSLSEELTCCACFIPCLQPFKMLCLFRQCCASAVAMLPSCVCHCPLDGCNA